MKQKLVSILPSLVFPVQDAGREILDVVVPYVRKIRPTELPFVSVILCAYNAEPTLDIALDSILAQEFNRFEVVAVDDGSTDRTLAILKRYAAHDSRVRVFHLKCNGGLSAALNVGVAHARSKYIARLDADDMMPPGRLKHQFDTLEANPKANLTCGRTIQFNETFERCFFARFPMARHPHAIRWYMLFRMIATHGGSMMRRKSVLQIGGYDAEFMVAEDFNMISRLARVGNFILTDRDTCYRRVWKDSLSRRLKVDKLSNRYRIIGDNLEHLLGYKLSVDKVRQLHDFWHGLEVKHLQPSVLESWLQEILSSYLRRYCLTPQEKRQAHRAICRITSEQYLRQTCKKVRRFNFICAGHLLALSCQWYAFGPIVHPVTFLKRWLRHSRIYLRKYEVCV